MYNKYIKRVLDLLLAVLALVVLSPLMLVLTVVGAILLGGNPFFWQPRPGLNEKIFLVYKFRSLNNQTDENGCLLPDEDRLVPWGRFLRSTSLDELPSLINIIMGDMALVGPRPQLVRDMVFMTPEQRTRHTVRPGLTGLAQCSGRNGIPWEKKMGDDLDYIRQGITFAGDAKIVSRTIWAVLRREGVSAEGLATSEDLGDYLLRSGRVTPDEYRAKMDEAENLLNEAAKKRRSGT